MTDINTFDFDRVIDRKNTNSLKHDFVVANGYPEDVIPLWVADMDFSTPDGVKEALHKAVEHGVFGYSEVMEGYYHAVSKWFQKHFGWETDASWLVKTPGVVYALAVAITAMTEPGDSVLIQTPVYYPFFQVIKDNQRVVVESELLYQNGHYEIDFQDFEDKIITNHVKLFILCSPHNPIGRVWTAEELKQIGDICKKHNVYVVSDEIHCDFAFEEFPHQVFIQVNPELTEQTIICTAPSKTFNLAGLQASNIWIPSKEIRNKFCTQTRRNGYSQLNTLGLVACQAAYETGEEWLIGCKQYLRNNLNLLRDFMERQIPEIKLVEPEGTYFAWLDCSGLGLEQKELNRLIIQDAKLWLDAGDIFGRNSGQFQRVVLASPQKIVLRALEQLKEAVNNNCSKTVKLEQLTHV